jgi:hypothetical protein
MALKVPFSFVHALPIVWHGEMHWRITEESFNENCERFNFKNCAGMPLF